MLGLFNILKHSLGCGYFADLIACIYMKVQACVHNYICILNFKKLFSFSNYMQKKFIVIFACLCIYNDVCH